MDDAAQVAQRDQWRASVNTSLDTTSEFIEIAESKGFSRDEAMAFAALYFQTMWMPRQAPVEDVVTAIKDLMDQAINGPEELP